jgi:glycogen debranching enzyme
MHELAPGLQPFLHDRTICVHAPNLWISGADGQIRDGIDGVFVADRRVLRQLFVLVNDQEPAAMSASFDGPHGATFMADARLVNDGLTPDPKVRVERRRYATVTGGTEDIIITNRNREVVTFTVSLDFQVDDTPLATVKNGQGCVDAPLAFTKANVCDWGQDDHAAELRFEPHPDEHDSTSSRWHRTLPPGATTTIRLQLHAALPPAPLIPAPDRPQWNVTSRAEDRHLDWLLDRSLKDLSALLMSDARQPSDLFAAAGAPWYMTLFGRDSLWAARMMLPVAPDLALSTARTLARRQGKSHDRKSKEAPGAILHEQRAAEAGIGLPPLYYGTIDATPLFVSVIAECLTDETEQDVLALLPAVVAALGWMAESTALGGGFLRYESHDGGLQNQGWKDSGDSIQWMNGALAKGPVALCEVQAYAYQAAMQGAGLLDHFGHDGAEWRRWAQALQRRFHDAFWIDHADGSFIALALDRDQQPVDGVASNMGHVLGTGLIESADERRVVERLMQGDMFSGWGIRTLSSNADGFNPVGYHNGSVWVHDTAIIARGMQTTGHTAEATTLALALLDAGTAFQYRYPELFSGDERTISQVPTPYPASCRPQAWAASSAVVIAEILGGLA